MRNNIRDWFALSLELFALSEIAFFGINTENRRLYRFIYQLYSNNFSSLEYDTTILSEEKMEPLFYFCVLAGI